MWVSLCGTVHWTYVWLIAISVMRYSDWVLMYANVRVDMPGFSHNLSVKKQPNVWLIHTQLINQHLSHVIAPLIFISMRQPSNAPLTAQLYLIRLEFLYLAHMINVNARQRSITILWICCACHALLIANRVCFTMRVHSRAHNAFMILSNYTIE